MNKIFIFTGILLLVALWVFNVYVLPDFVVHDEFELFLTICVVFTAFKFFEWLENQ